MIIESDQTGPLKQSPIARCLACQTITFPDGRKLRAGQYDPSTLQSWSAGVTDNMALSRECYDRAIPVWGFTPNTSLRNSYASEHC